MKKQLIILGSFIALTIAFVQAADATQTLVATGYTAPIEKLIAADQFPVNQDAIKGGMVTVDTDHQQISLTVIKADQPCNGQLVCLPNVNGPLHIKLPIQQIERDNCGTIQYTASQETTEGRQIIIVRDNNEYRCRNFMMLPKTSVNLVKQTRGNEASATFTAGSLQELH